MIVLDASVVVELLINGPLADSLRRELARSDDSFIVPHLLDVEVASALRKLVAGQRIDSHRSGELLAGLAALPAERYSQSLCSPESGSCATVLLPMAPPTSL
jgi:predicted nucleic acid-binding protein